MCWMCGVAGGREVVLGEWVRWCVCWRVGWLSGVIWVVAVQRATRHFCRMCVETQKHPPVHTYPNDKKDMRAQRHTSGTHLCTTCHGVQCGADFVYRNQMPPGGVRCSVHGTKPDSTPQPCTHTHTCPPISPLTSSADRPQEGCWQAPRQFRRRRGPHRVPLLRRRGAGRGTRVNEMRAQTARAHVARDAAHAA